MRKELTDEWKNHGITKEKDYAILSNEMTKAWSGMSVKEYKQLKGLKKENLRDNMTNIELVLNMLAEVTTTTISKQENPKTFEKIRRLLVVVEVFQVMQKKVWRRNRQKGNFPTQCKQ